MYWLRYYVGRFMALSLGIRLPWLVTYDKSLGYFVAVRKNDRSVHAVADEVADMAQGLIRRRNMLGQLPVETDTWT
jgi:hypothetical protein